MFQFLRKKWAYRKARRKTHRKTHRKKHQKRNLLIHQKTAFFSLFLPLFFWCVLFNNKNMFLQMPMKNDLQKTQPEIHHCTKQDPECQSGRVLSANSPASILSENSGVSLAKNRLKSTKMVENAPTCYRAPKWPDPEFPRKYREKKKAGSKFWNSKKIPPKKYQTFWYFGGIFWVFSVYFWGKCWESRISGRGVFFRYFSWKFRVGPLRGSVAGRGVLNKMGQNWLKSG